MFGLIQTLGFLLCHYRKIQIYFLNENFSFRLSFPFLKQSCFSTEWCNSILFLTTVKLDGGVLEK